MPHNATNILVAEPQKSVLRIFSKHFQHFQGQGLPRGMLYDHLCMTGLYHGLAGYNYNCQSALASKLQLKCLWDLMGMGKQGAPG